MCIASRKSIFATVVAAALGLLLWADPVAAHAAEQGFVLLLPTNVYVFSGAASVALTVVVLTLLPDRAMPVLFRPFRLPGRRPTTLPIVTSLAACGVFFWLIWTGVTGSRDPLANPLPLFVWTVWWIAIVTVQGLLGDVWRWINPWSGPVAVTRKALALRPFLRLPGRLGHGLAILSFLAFVALLLADPAPADPARLATFAGVYWVFTFLALLSFGPRWQLRAEGIGLLMRSYARLGLFGRLRGILCVGLSGWQTQVRRAPPLGAAIFILLMLGSGSFDGLNETFWWLDLLGINPLEFPGRSAVIGPNIAGLLIANAALIAAFTLAVKLGLMLAQTTLLLGRAFCLFAPSILPIALGYHVAHYLPSFLVDGQYALVAVSDPLATGADYLGLGKHFVSTGFFNSRDSVRLIWLTQAGAVVAGHILAVMLAHATAVRHFGNVRSAALSQAPLALFMVLYTLFGLWLLASPRGA